MTGVDGELIGVLGLDILLDDLRRILENLDIPKQGKALLLNSSGEIVAASFRRTPTMETG